MKHLKKGTKVSTPGCFQRKRHGKRQRRLTAKSGFAMLLSVILVFQSVDSIPVQAEELTSQVSETAETPESRVVIILESEANNETVGTPEGNSSDVPETPGGGCDDAPEFLESTDAVQASTEGAGNSGTSQPPTESAGDNETIETQTETTGDSSTDETQTETTGDSSTDDTQTEITEDGSTDETPAETTESSETAETQTEIAEDSDSTETPTGETGGETAENPTETEGNNETAAVTVTEKTIIEEVVEAALEEFAEGESESENGTAVVVSRNADVVFVIDATGSMGSYINKVKEQIAGFNKLLNGADVDVRIMFVVYRDCAIGINQSTFCNGWHSTTEDATAALGSITATGGGDGPETAIDGMGFMFQDDFGWRENTAKFSILLTDAPYKEDNTFDYTDQDIAEMLIDNNIVSSVIVRPSEECYDKWMVNGGKKGYITSDYKFLLEWVTDVIVPSVNNKFKNVTIEVRKDNVPWLEHGKSFILQNLDNGSYVENYNTVEDGNYRIYEVIVSDGYLDTGESITVSRENRTATVNYYTVYFVDGDNVYDQTSQIVLKGQTASQPNSPAKPGYSFIKWTTENNGMTPFDFSQGIDGTTFVYAKWKDNTYSMKHIDEHQQEPLEEIMEVRVDASSPAADTDAIVFVDQIVNKEPVPAPKDNEPKTVDTSHVEIYATIGMISGLFYLMLYFADRERGMTEEQKEEIIGSLVEWARKGKRIRKYVALAIIFVILVYYHSIGKRTTAEWKTLYAG